MKAHFILFSLFLAGCASTSPSTSHKSLEQLNAEAGSDHATALQAGVRAQANPTPENVAAAKQSAAASAAAATLAAAAVVAEEEQAVKETPQPKP